MSNSKEITFSKEASVADLKHDFKIMHKQRFEGLGKDRQYYKKIKEIIENISLLSKKSRERYLENLSEKIGETQKEDDDARKMFLNIYSKVRKDMPNIIENDCLLNVAEILSESPHMGPQFLDSLVMEGLVASSENDKIGNDLWDTVEKIVELAEHKYKEKDFENYYRFLQSITTESGSTTFAEQIPYVFNRTMIKFIDLIEDQEELKEKVLPVWKDHKEQNIKNVDLVDESWRGVLELKLRENNFMSFEDIGKFLSEFDDKEK